MKTVIFTDLDGSLLDETTYSFEKALPALALIGKREIPLILCSSKTRAEMEAYRKRLKNVDPFIVENGGAVFVPEGYFAFPAGSVKKDDYQVSVLGTPYDEIRKTFVLLRESLGISVQGFGDMTVEQLSRLTGLPAEEAVLARQREFDEPFLFERGADGRFLKAIDARGLRWTRGRFYHLMGEHDKGRAVRLLKRWYESEYGRLITIGLGDSLNDLPLLKEVDRPVLVRQATGKYDSAVELPGLIRTAGAGPAGWNEAVLDLLTDDTDPGA